MDEAGEGMPAFVAFPGERRATIRGTNPLGRVDGEIERRTGVAGIFPDGRAPKAIDAVARLAGAVLLEQNHGGAVQRRYTGRETPAPISDAPAVGLPAVTA